MRYTIPELVSEIRAKYASKLDGARLVKGPRASQRRLKTLNVGHPIFTISESTEVVVAEIVKEIEKVGNLFDRATMVQSFEREKHEIVNEDQNETIKELVAFAARTQNYEHIEEANEKILEGFVGDLFERTKNVDAWLLEEAEDEESEMKDVFRFASSVTDEITKLDVIAKAVGTVNIGKTVVDFASSIFGADPIIGQALTEGRKILGWITGGYAAYESIQNALRKPDFRRASMLSEILSAANEVSEMTDIKANDQMEADKYTGVVRLMTQVQDRALKVASTHVRGLPYEDVELSDARYLENIKSGSVVTYMCKDLPQFGYIVYTSDIRNTVTGRVICILVDLEHRTFVHISRPFTRFSTISETKVFIHRVFDIMVHGINFYVHNLAPGHAHYELTEDYIEHHEGGGTVYEFSRTLEAVCPIALAVSPIDFSQRVTTAEIFTDIWKQGSRGRHASEWLSVLIGCLTGIIRNEHLTSKSAQLEQRKVIIERNQRVTSQ